MQDIRHAFIVAVSALLFATQSLPAEEETAELSAETDSAEKLTADEVRFALAGLVDLVQSSRTGDVTVRCTLSFEDGTERSSTHHFVFDRDRSWVRYEKVSPERDSQYVRNGTEQALHIGGRHARSVNLYPLGHDIRVDNALPCDITKIGLVYWMDMRNHDQPTGVELAESFQNTPVHDARKLADGLIELTWKSQPKMDDLREHPTMGKYVAELERQGRTLSLPETVKTLRVDRDRGFIPVYLAADVRSPGGSSVTSHVQCLTNWERVNDVWVPVHCEMSSVEGSETTKRSVLDLSWAAVNSGISDDEFRIEALDLPNGTKIVSYALDAPVVTGIVGEPHRELRVPVEDRQSFRTRLLLVLVNVIVLAALAGVLCYRKCRR